LLRLRAALFGEEGTLSRERLYLVDGHSQIFRAYWARMRDLSSPSGEPTRATYIFCQVLLNLIERDRPEFLAIAMDGPEGPARRIAAWREYKANREAMPEDLVPQIRRIEQILTLAGIPVLRSPGEEADDVIATVIESLRDRDIEIYIVSSDKDLYQLLGPDVKLYDPQSGEVTDEETLMRTKGFTPAQAVEIQTLTGDKIDNVPGIPGVGIKKAAALIRKYGTAEAVLAHADELTTKMRENVKAFASQLPVTRSLVTLRRDCSIEFDLERARIVNFTLERLEPVFSELGFTSLKNRISASDDPRVEVSSARDALDLRGVSEVDELPPLAAELRRAGAFAVDTEATSLRPRDTEIVGMSFAWNAGGAVYVPIRSSRGKTVPLEAVVHHLGPVLEDPGLEKVGQNLKYDLQVLRRAGIELKGKLFDTMLASYLLNSERRSHGLDFLAREFLGYEPIAISEVLGRGAKEIRMDEADPELLTRYAAEDANVAWRLWKAMAPELDRRGLRKLFEEIEMPLVGVLADMEWHGVKLDVEHLEAVSAEFAGKLDALRERIWRAAGRAFNVDSPKQLSEILFDDLGLPVVKRTKTSRSTDAEVLKSLAATTGHPLPELVLRYRELSKLKGTYVDVLPRLISPVTGRIHPSYHQAVAATGRLSASDPNIQNIPIRTEEGRRIREAFIAEGDRSVLLSADYSQIELRILAHFSGDEALLEAFDRGEDIHRWVAGRVWGMPPRDVPPALRAQAKAVNFGIIYGQTAFGLGRTLGIPQGEAARFIREYKKKFRGIDEFVKRVTEEAGDTGVVRTILGRERPIPDIRSANRARRQRAERFAVNTVIQGSAADLIKAAMVAIHRELRERKEPGHMIIQVHDELVFEVDESRLGSVASVVEKVMCGAIPLRVPLKVDLSWGKNWLQGKG